MSNSVRPHRWQPTRLPHPWDSPGKNTGVGCLFLLQCMKVKSDSEVTQSFPTLSDPMDCSLPGFSVHGIFQVRVLEWVAISFSRGSSWPRDQTQVCCIAGRCYAISARLPVLVILIFKNLSILCATSYLYAFSLILENLLFFWFLFPFASIGYGWIFW